MYTGSGVLIIENYKKSVPSIVLVQNKRSKLLMDFGGGTGKTNDINRIKKLAIDEVYEESYGLIKLNDDIINNAMYHDSNAKLDGSQLYRTYILRIDNISTKLYNYNMNIFSNHDNIPKHWKETSRLVHIPIHNIDFDNILKRGNNKVKDVNNTTYSLTRRTRRVIDLHKDTLIEFMNNIDTIKYVMNRDDLILNTSECNVQNNNKNVQDALCNVYTFTS
jgi:hypothetical protein